jgi:hypothetical protein
MRYPKPGGCSGTLEEDEGKTRLTTVTDDDEFASRCGRGVDDGRSLLRIGGEIVDITCDGSKETQDVVVIYDACMQ